MGHGVYKVYVATMTSGATLTSEVDMGRSFELVYLSVPSMTSNSQLHIKFAAETGGTYRRAKHPVLNTTSAQAPQDFTIVSSATNCMVPIPGGFRFVKVESTATCDSGESFKILCAD